MATPEILSATLVDRVLAGYPTPIADAVCGLLAADSPHERRDRVVECFRAAVRIAAAMALAARVQFGPGGDGDSGEVQRLLRALRGRGLTDGQWIGLCRGLLAPWAASPAAHPTPALVALMTGGTRGFARQLDGLLAMRKAETVAHGATGDAAAIRAVLRRRGPQLEAVLEAMAPLWDESRLVVPLALGEDEQRAWLMMGDTPGRGRWRRVELARGTSVPSGEPVLIDADGAPRLRLHPIVLCRRPSPDAVEELFVLDGSRRRGAVYAAVPSMAEHRQSDVWPALDDVLLCGAEQDRDSASASGRPYRGLASFGPDDAAMFYGRDREVEALANRVRRHALVTVTGPSGCGKTSLIHAGVIPRLSEASSGVGQSGAWIVVTMRPGSRPLHTLGARLDAALGAGKADSGYARGEPGERNGDSAKRAELLEITENSGRTSGEPGELNGDSVTASRKSGEVKVDPAEADGQRGEVMFGSTGVISADASDVQIDAVGVSADASDVKVDATGAGAEPGEVKVDAAGAGAEAGEVKVEAAGAGGDAGEVQIGSTGGNVNLGEVKIDPAVGNGSPGQPAESLGARLVAEPDEAVRALSRLCSAAGHRLLLVIDQCEELFTLCADSRERRAFATAIAAAAADSAGPVRVMLSIRGDFFARLADLPALAGVYSRQVEVIATPGRDALIDILVRPAERFGYRFEEPALVEAMLAPLAGEPSALAILQFAADRMWTLRDRGWKRLTWAAYEGIGGALGALAAHAESVLDGLGDARRQAARALLLSLVTADGTRAVVSRRQIVAAGSRDAQTVLDALVEARLVVLREGDGGGDDEREGDDADGRDDARDAASARDSDGDALVELVHEALIEHWDALRAWRDEDAELLRTRDRVAQAAAQWHQEGGATDYLLADGKPLAEAEALLADHGHMLEPREVDLVRASQRRRRRKRRAARIALAFAVAVAVVAGLLGVRAWRVGRVAQREGERAQREVAARLEAMGLAERSAALAQESRRAALESDDEATLAQARAALAFDPTAALAWLTHLSPDSAGWDRGRQLAADARRRGFARHVLRVDAAVTHIRYAPDGARFATATAGGAVTLWDATTAARTEVRGHDGPVLAMEMSPDGHYLATAGADGVVRVVRVADNSSRPLDGHDGWVEAMAFSPDGRWLVTGGRDRGVLLWRIADREPPRALAGHQARITQAVFSPDSARVVTADADGAIYAWDVATGEGTALRGHTRAVEALALSPDGSALVSAGRDRAVRLWDLAGGGARVLARGSDTAVFLAFSPDGARVIGAVGEELRVWPVSGLRTSGAAGPDTGSSDFRTRPANGGRAGSSARGDVSLTGHSDRIAAMAASADMAVLATAGADHTVRVWRGPEVESWPLLGHGDRVTAVAVSPDGAQVVSGAQDGEIRVWTTDRGTRALVGHGDIVSAVAVAPDGEHVASAGFDGTVRVWPLSDPRVGGGAGERVLRGHEGAVQHVDFAPDGRRLVSAGEDGTVRLWDLASGEVRVLTGHVGTVWHAAFSPDGRWLASAGDDHTARVWDVSGADVMSATPATATATSATPAKTDAGLMLTGHRGAVVHVAFSPDSARLATASWDRTGRVWDPATGRTLAVLTGHDGVVVRVRWSPDGAQIATASWDRTACLWDVSGSRTRCLSDHGAEVYDLAFSPDGRWLVTGGGDRTARLWSLSAESASGPVRVWAGHDDEITSLVITPASDAVITASRDRTARWWPIPTDDVDAVDSADTADTVDVAAAPDRSDASSSARPARSNPSAGRLEPRVLDGHDDEINDVAIGPRGVVIATASDDGVVRVWIDDIPADPEALRAWLAAATTARWTEAGLASPRDME